MTNPPGEVGREPGGTEAGAPGAAGTWAGASWGARLEWAVVAALAILFFWKGFLVGWAALNTDFPNYYLGGLLFRAGWPLERLNDWIWMQRQKDHAGLDQPLVNYLPLTLWSSLIIVPLTWLPPLAAKRVWLVVNLLLLLAVGGLLRRLTALPYRRIALVVLLAIIPLRTSFQFGQQHLVVLFLLTLATWAFFRERPTLAGVALALAAALKLYPALFALYFCRKRQWRPLLALVAASLALLVAGAALFGVEALREYAIRILPRSLRGEFNDPYLTNLNSLTTFLRRLFVAEPDLNPVPLIRAPVVFVVVQPIVQAAVLMSGLWALDRGGSGAEKQKLDWAVFCVLLLLLSTGWSTYHLCAIILPAALAFDVFMGARQGRRAWLVLVAFALGCLPYGRFAPSSPAGWRILFGFPRLYALLALWALVAAAAWRARASSQGRRGGAEKAIWAVSFAAWVAVTIGSSARHFDGQLASYPARLAVESRPLIATAPVAVADDVYFTRMDEAGYVIDRIARGGAGIGRNLTAVVPRGADLFFPTATAASSDGWVELASTTSKVVRFPRAASRLTARDLAVEVDDAQQPRVSADARWLGFIREGDRGRGALWVIDRAGATPAGARPSRERQLLDATHDVLDFSFLPDDRIVLASYRSGRSTLSLIDPTSGQTAGLATSDRDARYPAASPDGRWIAYSELERGQWQIWVLNRANRERGQLTDADCNSTMASWSPDSTTLIYASDCGRGLGHTALCRIAANPHLGSTGQTTSPAW